eukprot:3762799-Rhodomonas_salina.1
MHARVLWFDFATCSRGVCNVTRRPRSCSRMARSTLSASVSRTPTSGSTRSRCPRRLLDVVLPRGAGTRDRGSETERLCERRSETCSLSTLLTQTQTHEPIACRSWMGRPGLSGGFAST